MLRLTASTSLSRLPMKNKDKNAAQENIISAYLSLVGEGVMFPTRSDLKSKGISRDQVRNNFGTMSKLREAAKDRDLQSFDNIIDLDSYLSDNNIKLLNTKIKKFKRFFITTAVSGQKVHDGFLSSIRTYCKKNKAMLLILPSHDPAHNLDNGAEWHFDNAINHKTTDYVYEDTYLNSNIFISGIRVTAKQINPITGLSELSQNKGSCIFASPKQSLEYDAVSAKRLPHARMTTGAITLPNYKTTKGNSLRTAYIADFQHLLGGVIVEIKNDNIFHFRQVQADNKGNFCDLGVEYSPVGSKKVDVTFVMGDYHAGEHDMTAVTAWTEVINQTAASHVIFHDLFNGNSISHHMDNNIIAKSNLATNGLNSLAGELQITASEVDRFGDLKSVKKLVIVKSNHDDFIDRYLQRGGFIKDPINFHIGCKLAAEVVGTSKDYLEEGFKIAGLPRHYKKMKFLSVDEDYTVGGVHLGAHGDKASNGAKGSIKSMAKSYPKCVVGHSHTPGIFKGARQVGTTSLKRLGYNKGPSSWIHCSALVYNNGQVQLINSIEGEWHLK